MAPSILHSGICILLASFLIACVPACTPTPTTQPPPPVQPLERPAEFQVSSLTVKPSGIMVGDSATITATVTNTGDMSGTYTAILSIDGQEVDREHVSIEPSNSEEVTFQLTRTTAGSYELAVGESNAVLTVYDWNPYTIKYDKGVASLVIMYGGKETGHIVHFTPPAKPFKIQRIQMCMELKVQEQEELTKRQVTVRIWNSDKSKQLWTHDFLWHEFRFSHGNWTDIKVPAIRADNDFHVEIVTHSDTGDYANNYIGMAYEKCEGETRSNWSVNGLIVATKGKYSGLTWLVRVAGESAPFSLAYDNGKTDAFMWTTDKSHLVHFSPTSTGFKLQKILIYGNALTKEANSWQDRNFTVKVWDKVTGSQLWGEDFPWQLFSGIEKWVEIQVPNVICTNDFDIELTTNSTDACRLGIGYDSSVPNKHSYMSIDGKVTPWQPWTYQGVEYTIEKANWMIRAEGTY